MVCCAVWFCFLFFVVYVAVGRFFYERGVVVEAGVGNTSSF